MARLSRRMAPRILFSASMFTGSFFASSGGSGLARFMGTGGFICWQAFQKNRNAKLVSGGIGGQCSFICASRIFKEVGPDPEPPAGTLGGFGPDPHSLKLPRSLNGTGLYAIPLRLVKRRLGKLRFSRSAAQDMRCRVGWGSRSGTEAGNQEWRGAFLSFRLTPQGSSAALRSLAAQFERCAPCPRYRLVD